MRLDWEVRCIFNEGLRVGHLSAERSLLEMEQIKQDYLNENERLTNLLLEAEDRIQELESALLMSFGTF